MVCVWSVYGQYMVSVWSLCMVCMVSVWSMYDQCIGYAGHFCNISSMISPKLDKSVARTRQHLIMRTW